MPLEIKVGCCGFRYGMAEYFRAFRLGRGPA